MSLKQILVFIFISAQIVSCGSKNLLEKIDGLEAPDDSVRKLNPIENNNDGIILNVKKYKDGADVKVESFHKQFMGSLVLEKDPKHFYFDDSGINEESCARVRKDVLEYKKNKDKTYWYNLRNSSVKVDLDSQIKFIKVDFDTTVKKFIAGKLGIDWNKVYYYNKFKITDIAYDIEYKKEAISKILYEDEESKNTTQEFINYTMKYFGETTVHVGLTELVCDLYMGNARLSMEYIGRDEETGKGFAAQVSFNKIRTIYRKSS